MNITFDVNTDEGDKIVVSLFSYPFLPENLTSDKIEIVEININREAGYNTIMPKTFKRIAEKLIQIAEMNENIIYYYFCDSNEAIPYKRHNDKSTVQCYRDRLFSSMFLRYSKVAKEIWTDNRVVMNNDEITYYAHFITRKSHDLFIKEIEKEINNDFNLISDSK